MRSYFFLLLLFSPLFAGPSASIEPQWSVLSSKEASTATNHFGAGARAGLGFSIADVVEPHAFVQYGTISLKNTEVQDAEGSRLAYGGGLRLIFDRAVGIGINYSQAAIAFDSVSEGAFSVIGIETSVGMPVNKFVSARLLAHFSHLEGQVDEEDAVYNELCFGISITAQMLSSR